MPKFGEKSRKLKVLRTGGNVRPPKRWWNKMYRMMSKEYPTYGKLSLSRIVGGIWSNYSVSTKMKLVSKYQR